MSWNKWNAKFSDLVSQGFDQVNKLKDDVEKQFDEAVGKPTKFATDATPQETTVSNIIEPPKDDYNTSIDAISVDTHISQGMTDDNIIEPPSGASNTSSINTCKYSPEETPSSSIDDYSDDFFDDWESKTMSTSQRMSNSKFLAPRSNENPLLHTPENTELLSSTSCEEVLEDSVVHSQESDEIGKIKHGDKMKMHQEDGNVPLASGINEADPMVSICANETEKADPLGKEESNVYTVDPFNIPKKNSVPLTQSKKNEAETKIEIKTDLVEANSVISAALDDNVETEKLTELYSDAPKGVPMEEPTDIRIEGPTKDYPDSRNFNQFGESVQLTTPDVMAQRDLQIEKLSTTIAILHGEIESSSTESIALKLKIEKLTHELDQSKKVASQALQSNASVSQIQAEIEQLRQVIAEKDIQISGLHEEGKALSIKQAQYEQRLRTLRKEKDHEESIRIKTESDLSEIRKIFEKTNSQLVDAKEVADTHLKQFKTLELEHDDLLKKHVVQSGEIHSLKSRVQSLESALSEEKSRYVELEEKFDSLKVSTDKNLSLSEDKNVLEVTVHQLEETLKHVEIDSNHREKLLRSEVAEMRRRWEEAVTRIEEMGHCVSEATQPLLRQIKALQTDQRAKVDTWKTVEQDLVRRIKESEELKQKDAEQIQGLKSLSKENTHTISLLKKELGLIKDDSERERAKINMLIEKEQEYIFKIRRLENTSEELMMRNNDLSRQKKSLEESHVRQIALIEDRSQGTMNDLESAKLREDKFQDQIRALQNEIKRMRSRGSTLTRASTYKDESSTGILQATIQSSNMNGELSNFISGGETTALEINKLKQKIKLKESENRSLQIQLREFEDSKSSLSQELVKVTTKLSLFEEQDRKCQSMSQELQVFRARHDLLLEMLGEKEEQIEDIQAEIDRMKSNYENRIKELEKKNSY